MSITRMIRSALLAGAATVALCFVANDAKAQCAYGGGGGHGYGGRSGLSISIGGYGGGYGGFYSPPVRYRSYRPAYYHDTTHLDYHPGEYVRHRNHYDYIPGHYDVHRTGHWHH